MKKVVEQEEEEEGEDVQTNKQKIRGRTMTTPSSFRLFNFEKFVQRKPKIKTKTLYFRGKKTKKCNEQRMEIFVFLKFQKAKKQICNQL